jgi:murein DD-endopeptidase
LLKTLVFSLFLGGALWGAVVANAYASLPIQHLAGSRHAVASAQPRHSPAQAVLKRALGTLGAPYRWGGASPERGFDCSGLVSYAFRKVDDLELPRTSREQSRVDRPRVAKGHLKPGDLLFFRLHGRGVDHVAIYLGNERFIHAPHRGTKVRIDTLSDDYWSRHFQLARRVVSEASRSG